VWVGSERVSNWVGEGWLVLDAQKWRERANMGSYTHLVDQLVGRERRELLERVGDKGPKGRAEIRAVLEGLALFLVDNGVDHTELLQLVGINLGREGRMHGYSCHYASLLLSYILIVGVDLETKKMKGEMEEGKQDIPVAPSREPGSPWGIAGFCAPHCRNGQGSTQRPRAR